jgi:hypothetical protein
MISSEDQIADGFTKSLSVRKFIEFCTASTLAVVTEGGVKMSFHELYM